MAKKNVFVFGLNDFNLRMLKQVRGAEDIVFHKLLDRSELVERMHYPVEEILDHARERLSGISGSVGGMIHYIDFEDTASVAVVCIGTMWLVPSPAIRRSVRSAPRGSWSRGGRPDMLRGFLAYMVPRSARAPACHDGRGARLLSRCIAGPATHRVRHTLKGRAD